MNYQEIEDYFKTDEGLTALLAKCNPAFEAISKYDRLFQNNDIRSADEIKEALTKLAGYQMFLEPIYSEADTQKKYYEDWHYAQQKEEAIQNNAKFLDGGAKKTASLYVSKYRSFRNKVNGKIKSCITGIMACQSLLKFMSEEIRLSR